jgi:hypothetical protein
MVMTFNPSFLATNAADQFAWRDVRITSVESAVGSQLDLHEKDIATISSFAISYTPPAGFVGIDSLIVSGLDSNGESVNGTIDVNVSDATLAEITLDAVEDMRGNITTTIEVPQNALTGILQFSLGITFDPSVVRLDSNSAIGPQFDSLRRLDVVQTNESNANVYLEGLATGSLGDLLATLRFTRLAPGDANIQLGPALDWQVSLGDLPLSPQAVDVLYSEYSSADTNRDGIVTPIDSLRIINALNRGGSNQVELDVNGDGLVNNADSTLITNFLTALGTSYVDTVIGAVDSIVNYESGQMDQVSFMCSL